MTTNDSDAAAALRATGGSDRERLASLIWVIVLVVIRLVLQPLPGLVPATAGIDPATGLFLTSDPLGPARQIIPVLAVLLYIANVLLAYRGLALLAVSRVDLTRVLAFVLAAVIVLGTIVLSAAPSAPLLDLMATPWSLAGGTEISILAAIAFAGIGVRGPLFFKPKANGAPSAPAPLLAPGAPAPSSTMRSFPKVESAAEFEPLLARSVDEPNDSLWPLPDGGLNSFVLESADGRNLRWWEAVAVTATMGGGQSAREVARATNIRAAVALTDSRLVFACTRFRTGGGWTGYGPAGAAAALTINAVSKSMASRQTRGYTLVGHVRHQWLAGVTASKSRWGSSAANAVSLIYMDPTGKNGVCRLNLHLPKKQSTHEVARALLQRAVQAQLNEADEARRVELKRFLTTLPSAPLPSGDGESWILP